MPTFGLVLFWGVFIVRNRTIDLQWKAWHYQGKIGKHAESDVEWATRLCEGPESIGDGYRKSTMDKCLASGPISGILLRIRFYLIVPIKVSIGVSTSTEVAVTRTRRNGAVVGRQQQKLGASDYL